MLFDINNTKIITLDSTDERPLNDSLISTKSKDHLKGIANREGKVVIPQLYSQIEVQENGFIKLVKKNDIGVIDAKANIVLPTVFKDITFGKDLFYTSTQKTKSKLLLDKEIGKEVRTWKNSLAQHNTNHNTFANTIAISQNNLCGAFDRQGNLIIPFEYDRLRDGIEKDIIAVKSEKYGIINRQNQVTLDFNFNYIIPYYNKNYFVKKDKLFGLLDKDKQTVLPIIYQSIVSVSDGIYWCTNEDGMSEVKVDANGQIIHNKKLPIESHETIKKPILKELPYYIVNSSEEYAIINKDYKDIIRVKKNGRIPLQYDDSFHFEEDGDTYTTKGYRLADHDINLVVDPIGFHNILICKKEGKVGVIDLEGNIIVPFKYKKILPVNNTLYIVVKF